MPFTFPSSGCVQFILGKPQCGRISSIGAAESFTLIYYRHRRPQKTSMAESDFEWDYLDSFFNNSTVDPEYVRNEPVVLCGKSDVIHFGAELLPAFYYINFFLSLLGNGLVLCIIYKYEKLSTVTNIFLLNLVISDLIFASSLPFWAVYHSSQWIFGSTLCKLVRSFYSIGFNSSILFLTLMTFDRYLAVVHAITAAQSRRRAYAFASSAVVWVLSVLASLKDIVLHDVRENQDSGMLCEVTGYTQSVLIKWELFGYYQQFLLFFLMPLAIVLYCYVRITIRIMYTRMAEKCRAVKLIFIIIFTFFICWTPYNVVILLQAIKTSFGDKSQCSNALDYALYVTQNFAYLYCCISPVFYTFLGKKFQNHFLKLLAKRLPCLKITVLSTHSSKSTSFRSPNTDY
ncbi:C-C chemokine receptor type 5-like isoform X2 [Myxocyprinus asiaticus]|uniref:C-C chemokine receptor type 5-like isoform X2 n=1 Tax=Myxocyprinus asiaticus TaxID=70543 RepID=UPI0022217ACE|nr:C-C chemokine receptor type 5-like isoform X2 [Myxocyprinus asiaticus]